MAAVIILSTAGIAYCAFYLVYCIKRAQLRDAIGAAALCLLACGALAFSVL